MRRRPPSVKKERAILLAALGHRNWSFGPNFVAFILIVAFVFWLLAAVAIFPSLSFGVALFTFSCLLAGLFWGAVAYHRLAMANLPVLARHLNKESILARLNELGT